MPAASCDYRRLALSLEEVSSFKHMGDYWAKHCCAPKDLSTEDACLLPEGRSLAGRRGRVLGVSATCSASHIPT